jgi:hypothetical protein
MFDFTSLQIVLGLADMSIGSLLITILLLPIMIERQAFFTSSLQSILSFLAHVQYLSAHARFRNMYLSPLAPSLSAR